MTDSATATDRVLTIGIPLRSRKTTPDWGRTSALLQSTLDSIARQTQACRRVIVACHDQPDVKVPAALRLEFVNAHFDPPIFTWELELDKLRKLEVIAARHRQHGGGKLFLLDADDLLDMRFVGLISSRPEKIQILSRGYQWDTRSGRISNLPRFWRRCGSCGVVDWTVDELPTVALAPDDTVFRRFADTRHYRWPQFAQERGWSIYFVPEPVAMYMVNHGENISKTVSSPNLKWRLYNRFMPKKRASSDIVRRFGVNG